MKRVLWFFLCLITNGTAYAQHVYQIRADSVRIYNVCDTAELIIENRTRGVAGFLFNKNDGRTEFRKLKLETIGNNQIAITGQDTLDISGLPGIGGVDTIYRDGDYIKYTKRGITHPIYLPEALSSFERSANKSTNTSLGASDVLYPTQNAVKTYVDSRPVPSWDATMAVGRTTSHDPLFQRAAAGTVGVELGREPGLNAITSGNGTFVTWQPLALLSGGLLVSDRVGDRPPEDGSSALQVNGQAKFTNNSNDNSIQLIPQGAALPIIQGGNALANATKSLSIQHYGGRTLFNGAVDDGSSALQVDGNIRATGSNSMLWGNSDWAARYNAGNARFELYRSGGEFVINNTGNVGIGTINPTTKLQVDGAVTINDNNVSNMPLTTSRLVFKNTGINGSISTLYKVVGTGTPSNNGYFYQEISPVAVGSGPSSYVAASMKLFSNISSPRLLFTLNPADIGDQAQAQFTGRVSGLNGRQNSDFITVSQLNSAKTSGDFFTDGSYNLTTNSENVTVNGSADDQIVLFPPSATGNAGRVIRIYNFNSFRYEIDGIGPITSSAGVLLCNGSIWLFKAL